MRAWAIPNPVPSKPTFMVPSEVSLPAQASDNHAGHGSGRAIRWSPWHPSESFPGTPNRPGPRPLLAATMGTLL
jgi:hypothetical protein